MRYLLIIFISLHLYAEEDLPTALIHESVNVVAKGDYQKIAKIPGVGKKLSEIFNEPTIKKFQKHGFKESNFNSLYLAMNTEKENDNNEEFKGIFIVTTKKKVSIKSISLILEGAGAKIKSKRYKSRYSVYVLTDETDKETYLGVYKSNTFVLGAKKYVYQALKTALKKESSITKNKKLHKLCLKGKDHGAWIAAELPEQYFINKNNQPNHLNTVRTFFIAANFDKQFLLNGIFDTASAQDMIKLQIVANWLKAFVVKNKDLPIKANDIQIKPEGNSLAIKVKVDNFLKDKIIETIPTLERIYD